MTLSEAAQQAIQWRWKRNARAQAFEACPDPGTYFFIRDEKYRYPSYTELVGPTLPEHRQPDGRFTLERKAQLLLIGVFHWSGLYITQRPVKNDHDPRGWQAVTEFDLTLPLHLYCDHWHSRGKPVEQFQPYYAAQHNYYFDALANLDPIPLERILTRCPTAKRAAFLDGNPYNCRPENLLIVPKRGRPKRCRNCDREVFDGHHFAVAVRENLILRLCSQCQATISPAILEDRIRRWY